MPAFSGNTFSKKERLCGKTSVAGLLRDGHWGTAGNLKFCAARREGNEQTRILVSVPKKFFKRAVKRNLLKRRIREAYRTSKAELGEGHYDIMFQYNSSEIDDFATISKSVGETLKKISGQ